MTPMNNPAQAPAPPAARASNTRPCRLGLKPATCYLCKEARKQLKMLAWKNETTIENVLREGLNCVFAKHGMPEIIHIKGKGGSAGGA